MKLLSRRTLALSLAVVMGSTMLAGCGGKKDGGGTDVSSKLDKNIKGEISYMTWAGDSKYYEDIGHMSLTTQKLTAANIAAIYAVAKKFNEKYPNVKINLWAKANDPDQPGTPSWDQEMENFKTKYKKYPDIWSSTSVTNDIKKGLVADLSVYKDDETYKKYNQGLMKVTNYHGVQAALPSFSIPWGVWINKSLAQENNIDIPSPDWTIDEYTEFFNSSDNKTFWGGKSTPTSIINVGTDTINKQITTKGDVKLDSDQVKDMLKYIPKWTKSTIDSAEGAGTLSKEIQKESGVFSWFYFCNNRTLTNIEDPWYLTAGADPAGKSINSPEVIKANDWDIYPFPSTDYNKNTVKVVLDPICVHNYSADDGNTEWSEAEKQKLLLSYTFASYLTASTEAKQAVFDQKYTAAGTEKSAAGDSFPVVTGKDYEDQMKIWNSHPAHKVYKDKEGFKKINEIWQKGEYWDYSDKTWTTNLQEKGETTDCLYEWKNMWNEEVAGVWQGKPGWENSVLSKLSDWNTTCNKRIKKSQQQLNDALKKYYHLTDADLKK